MKVWYAHKNGTPLLDHWFPMCAAERFVSFADHQAALDAVLKEAIKFATVIVEQYEKNPSRLHVIPLDGQYLEALDFLALPLVQDYLKREEKARQKEGDDGGGL